MEKIPIRYINNTPTEPSLSGSFNIRSLRDLLNGKDMVQELHGHDYFFILALKEGTGDHEIDFTQYEVCGNSIFFLRPGQVHRLMLKVGTTGYLIRFRIDFYYPRDKVSNQLLRKAAKVNLYQPDADRFQKLLSNLTYIFNEYTDKQDGYLEVIKANLGIFFIELVRQQSRSFSNNVNPYMQERLEEFLQLLETHISDQKQVTQYAAMLNLSTYQLNAITKATLGKTCSERINEQIILESKRYLLATSNQVNQIAYHMGYEDVSYFIRFFKKQTGYSPEAFRNNFK
ncbi:MAG: helix-turn-helix domain-containing protein [Ignavibacteriales bacterium]|nr:helix-turn-helix domain-containing protein [Ignavibacteriales bacterium]